MTQETDHDSPKGDEDVGAGADEAGTEGQDRESYSDDQDRESYVSGGAEGDEAGAEGDGDAEAAMGQDDEAARRAKVTADAPYSVEGFSVYDGRGNRVAICGTDDNRATSGPPLALVIADVLNRVAGRR